MSQLDKQLATYGPLLVPVELAGGVFKLLTYGAGLMYLLLEHIALDVQVLRKGHRGEENVLMIQQCMDSAKG